MVYYIDKTLLGLIQDMCDITLKSQGSKALGGVTYMLNSFSLRPKEPIKKVVAKSEAKNDNSPND